MAIGKLALAGMAAEAIGTVASTASQSKQADAQADIIKQNQANEAEAMRKDQRANIGSMFAGGAGSGVSLSSFSDLFNNQTIEDGIQNAQSKQASFNELAATKNKKKSALISGAISLGQQGISLGERIAEDRSEG